MTTDGGKRRKREVQVEESPAKAAARQPVLGARLSHATSASLLRHHVGPRCVRGHSTLVPGPRLSRSPALLEYVITSQARSIVLRNIVFMVQTSEYFKVCTLIYLDLTAQVARTCTSHHHVSRDVFRAWRRVWAPPQLVLNALPEL